MYQFHSHVKLLILLVRAHVTLLHTSLSYGCCVQIANSNPLLFPCFSRVYVRAGNLVDQSMTADLTGEVTSAAGPVRLSDLQRILSAIQPSGMSKKITSFWVCSLVRPASETYLHSPGNSRCYGRS